MPSYEGTKRVVKVLGNDRLLGSAKHSNVNVREWSVSKCYGAVELRGAVCAFHLQAELDESSSDASSATTPVVCSTHGAGNIAYPAVECGAETQLRTQCDSERTPAPHVRRVLYRWGQSGITAKWVEMFGVGAPAAMPRAASAD
ncbi:unnamed protein product [Arctia plantaginis]|uniref:Uncharacterized protein n=1 Tax=Arctia plantaginis TaxID=874455 RepID=A0A8S1AZD4_ARCPL|nr:unnamed protein product [Arctia plantaginis]